MKSEHVPKTPSPRDTLGEPRRNVLVSLAALLVGGVISLFGVVVGVIPFLDPLLRKPTTPRKYRRGAGDDAGPEGYVRVATLAAVPDDGVPRRFPVLIDRRDAWNFYPQEPSGAVYVRRESGAETVTVFHSTCPHAGCAVSYAAERQFYHCPCHNSAFGLDGEKIDLPGRENPSPRPMDSLDVDAERLAATGEIWIRFLDFHTGRAAKEPKT